MSSNIKLLLLIWVCSKKGYRSLSVFFIWLDLTLERISAAAAAANAEHYF